MTHAAQISRAICGSCDNPEECHEPCLDGRPNTVKDIVRSVLAIDRDLLELPENVERLADTCAQSDVDAQCPAVLRPAYNGRTQRLIRAILAKMREIGA